MKGWEKIILKPANTLETAVKVLHEGELGIALVVDGEGKLLGTITDSDIRRALIKHVGMEELVTNVMNHHPINALVSDSPRQIMSIMKIKSLSHVPVVDKQGVLVDLETLKHLLEVKKYDNPVFLMAGGFGTRLHPLTENKPKPLLNVGSRPILETIVTQFIAAGFHNFYISTHYKAEMIREHFGDGSDRDIIIEYVHEENPLGTAGSLGLLPDNMPELPVVMMNGDILTKVNIEHLLNFHHEQEGLATMCIREYDFQVPYGVVDIEGQYVAGIVEKPVQKFFVNAGIYVLEPKLISAIDGSTYLDMPNLLENEIERGEKVSVFPIHEYWLDIGRMEEYENAHKSFEREFV